MTGYMTATREEWLAARLELLEPENELTGSAEMTRGGQTMNPVTFVTPTVRRLAANYLMTNSERSAVNGMRFSPKTREIALIRRLR
jgi:hypothetical protein